MARASWSISIGRFKTITGLSADELEALATMSADEFEEARKGGFFKLRRPEEPPIDEAPPSAVALAEPSAEAPAPVLAPVGAERFARTMQEFSEMTAALQAAE
jgi:hypothetical protein